ncbi:hypothetical protein C0989_002428 [Termitomyces sp. Mn162]|nr:hypothetical protein C0989_002428 [Termitomyces sp. Mn162]
MSSAASSQDTPTEESMRLDYANNSSVHTNPHPETTLQVFPSPLYAAIAMNISTPPVPEAGTSGSNNMANTVLEHWADIVSNEEAVASKMDEQAG